ncbi:hypothetical protein FKM82_020203 [Ascaphus truei]
MVWCGVCYDFNSEVECGKHWIGRGIQLLLVETLQKRDHNRKRYIKCEAPVVQGVFPHLKDGSRRRTPAAEPATKKKREHRSAPRTGVCQVCERRLRCLAAPSVRAPLC